eukprot:gene13289-biopygen15186
MTVPGELLISVMSAEKQPELAQVLKKHHLTSHQVQTGVVKLQWRQLQQQQQQQLLLLQWQWQSFWAPYIRQLPPRFTNLMTWQPAAVQALQRPHAQAAAAAAVDKARHEWCAAQPALQQLGLAKKWCSLPAWRWASSCLLSRTMYHPDDPECGCLTPLADLHNYGPPAAPFTPQLLQDAAALVTQQQQQQQRHQEGQQQRVSTHSCAPGVQVSAACSDRMHIQQHCNRSIQQPQQQQGQGSCCKYGAGPPDALQSSSDSHCAPHNEAASTGATDQTNRLQDRLGQGGCCGAADPAPGSCADGRDSPVAVCGDGAWDAAAGVYSIVARQRSAAADQPSFTTMLLLPLFMAFRICACKFVALAGSLLNNVILVHKRYRAVACFHFAHDAGQGRVSSSWGRSAWRYQPGQEVFLCYGRHTNLDLLELYGFMLEANPHDTAQLSVTMLREQFDLQLQQQQQQQHVAAELQRHQSSRQQQHHKQGRQHRWCGQVTLNIAAADCFVHLNGQPSWQLLAALRSSVASSSHQGKSQAHLALVGTAISASNELFVLRMLQAVCEQELQLMCGTDEENEQVLQCRSFLITADAVGLTGCGPVGKPPVGCQQHDELHHHKQQQVHFHHQQRQQQQEHEKRLHQYQCRQLAMLWKFSQKLILGRCVAECQQSIAMLLRLFD